MEGGLLEKKTQLLKANDKKEPGFDVENTGAGKECTSERAAEE